MLNFWGLKWTIEASNGHQYLKCLETKIWGSCQEPCVLFVLTQPSQPSILTSSCSFLCYLDACIPNFCLCSLGPLSVMGRTKLCLQLLKQSSDRVSSWQVALNIARNVHQLLVSLAVWSSSSFLQIVSGCKFLQITQDAPERKHDREATSSGCWTASGSHSVTLKPEGSKVQQHTHFVYSCSPQSRGSHPTWVKKP